MTGGTIITVDYTMKERARKLNISLNDTTLYETILQAKRFSDVFLSEQKKKEKFEDRLFELLVEESVTEWGSSSAG